MTSLEETYEKLTTTAEMSLKNSNIIANQNKLFDAKLFAQFVCHLAMLKLDSTASTDGNYDEVDSL